MKKKNICEKAWITFCCHIIEYCVPRIFFSGPYNYDNEKITEFSIAGFFSGEVSVVPHILYFRDWFNFVFYAYHIAFLSPFNHVKDLPVKAGITLWFRLCIRCCLFKGMLQQFCGVAAPSTSSFFLSMTRNVISISVHGHTTDFEWIY